jgi:DNA-binding MarR family transcriptional regulator
MVERGSDVDRAVLIARFLLLRPVLSMHLTLKALPLDLKEQVQAITLHQIAALQQILPDGLIMRDLARALDITDGSAAVLSDRLVKRGLAVRRSDPTDRRVVWLVPSEEARSVIARYRECEGAMLTSAFSVLSDAELESFVSMLERIATAYDCVPTPDTEDQRCAEVTN